MKRELNWPINAVNIQVFEEKCDNYTQADMHKIWAKLTLTKT